ncbi:MAG: hypothetical protein ABIF88_03905 [archaeon]
MENREELETKGDITKIISTHLKRVRRFTISGDAINIYHLNTEGTEDEPHITLNDYVVLDSTLVRPYNPNTREKGERLVNKITAYDSFAEYYNYSQPKYKWEEQTK